MFPYFTIESSLKESLIINKNPINKLIFIYKYELIELIKIINSNNIFSVEKIKEIITAKFKFDLKKIIFTISNRYI